MKVAEQPLNPPVSTVFAHHPIDSVWLGDKT
jgi:hypothetical protein